MVVLGLTWFCDLASCGLTWLFLWTNPGNWDEDLI